MNQGNAPDPAEPSQGSAVDPFQLLGIAVDASFDEVQAARAQLRAAEATAEASPAT